MIGSICLCNLIVVNCSFSFFKFLRMSLYIYVKIVYKDEVIMCCLKFFSKFVEVWWIICRKGSLGDDFIEV